MNETWNTSNSEMLFSSSYFLFLSPPFFSILPFCIPIVIYGDGTVYRVKNSSVDKANQK
jgi:hypothetical protein